MKLDSLRYGIWCTMANLCTSIYIQTSDHIWWQLWETKLMQTCILYASFLVFKLLLTQIMMGKKQKIHEFDKILFESAFFNWIFEAQQQQLAHLYFINKVYNSKYTRSSWKFQLIQWVICWIHFKINKWTMDAARTTVLDHWVSESEHSKRLCWQNLIYSKMCTYN